MKYFASCGRRSAADGFSSYWLAEHPTGGLDAMMVLTLVGLRVPDIELGTAIIPTFPRHPVVLAGQVHTLQNAIGNRQPGCQPGKAVRVGLVFPKTDSVAALI